MCRAITKKNRKCKRRGIYDGGLCMQHSKSRSPVMDECAICMEPLGSKSILAKCDTCENSVHERCHGRYSMEFGSSVKVPCVICRSPMKFSQIQVERQKSAGYMKINLLTKLFGDITMNGQPLDFNIPGDYVLRTSMTRTYLSVTANGFSVEFRE